MPFCHAGLSSRSLTRSAGMTIPHIALNSRDLRLLSWGNTVVSKKSLTFFMSVALSSLLSFGAKSKTVSPAGASVVRDTIPSLVLKSSTLGTGIVELFAMSINASLSFSSLSLDWAGVTIEPSGLRPFSWGRSSRFVKVEGVSL